MPRLKKVAPARTEADVDAGLLAVAQEYRSRLAVARAEYIRISQLASSILADIDTLSAKVHAVDTAIGQKVFNENL